MSIFRTTLYQSPWVLLHTIAFTYSNPSDLPQNAKANWAAAEDVRNLGLFGFFLFLSVLERQCNSHLNPETLKRHLVVLSPSTPEDPITENRTQFPIHKN